MRSILFSMAALVVATNAFAQDHDVVHAGIVRQMNAHEDQNNVVHAGMVRQYQALQRQVAAMRQQSKAAEKVLAKCEDKAVKSGKARSRFLARLGVCIEQLAEVRKLSTAVASLEGRVSKTEGDVDALKSRMSGVEGRVDALDGRMSGVEGNVDAVKEVVEDHRLRIMDLEHGASVALLAGPAVIRGGVPFNLGFGLSLPVAQGDAHAETEVLVGLLPEHLALTVRERVRQAGDGFVLGGNIMFLAQARMDLTAAREVFLGAGPSVGWSWERRVSVYIDLAGGPDRVAGQGWKKFGGSAGLTLAVKF